MGGASPSSPIFQGPTEDFIQAKGARGEVKVKPPLAPPCLMDKMDRRPKARLGSKRRSYIRKGNTRVIAVERSEGVGSYSPSSTQPFRFTQQCLHLPVLPLGMIIWPILSKGPQ